MLAEILEDPITVICEAPLPMCSPEVLADCFLRRVADLAPVTDQPFIAILNGEPLLRAGWGRRLIPGDELAFVLLPLGGGGATLIPCALSCRSLSWLSRSIPATLQRSGSLPRMSCLLYTSPSPRDGLLSRMPSSA